jgi:hypothetical protein
MINNLRAMKKSVKTPFRPNTVGGGDRDRHSGGTAGSEVSLRRPRQQLRQACAFKASAYLSVKVLPSTARPALAELPPVAPARLGTPVIVLATRDASVRAAPVSSFAHPSLSLPHVPTPLRAALPPCTSHPLQRDRSIPRSISVGHSALARSAMLVRRCS